MEQPRAFHGGKSCAGGRVGIIRPELGAGPLLLAIIVRRDEKNLLVEPGGLVACRAGEGFRDQGHDAVRLVPSGQVIAILVLMEGSGAGGENACRRRRSGVCKTDMVPM